MKVYRILVGGLLLIGLGAGLARGAPEQQVSVISGCGGRCGQGTVQTVICVGQSGTTGVSGNARYTHYAGFIGGAFLRPGTTNAEGQSLEADPDNDDDTLDDTAEVSGSAFGGHTSTDPNQADTDGDGMDDAAEAGGMYDPNDPDHALKILSLEYQNGQFTLTWMGKGGNKVNAILYAAGLPPGTILTTLHSAPYAGGDAPWYKAMHTHTWTGDAGGERFFQLETDE